jgi:hypothetical protein
LTLWLAKLARIRAARTICLIRRQGAGSEAWMLRAA